MVAPISHARPDLDLTSIRTGSPLLRSAFPRKRNLAARDRAACDAAVQRSKLIGCRMAEWSCSRVPAAWRGASRDARRLGPEIPRLTSCHDALATYIGCPIEESRTWLCLRCHTENLMDAGRCGRSPTHLTRCRKAMGSPRTRGLRLGLSE